MPRTDYTGQTLDGRYKIIRLLGKGGMGAVYLGQHVIIGKQVAVKFLHAEYAGREEIVYRFYREAQAAAAIGHKNIIDVMDVGVSSDGEPYMVMEYLTGESLQTMLRRVGPIEPAAAWGILEPALLALQAAHEKGIIHRDLKPENIFLVHRPDEPPTIKIIDFGISKFTMDSDQSKLTQTGSTIGTPAYMSPEQARCSADIDRRADIYSVGVILYEMLTGELPFKAAHHNEMLVKVLTEPPRPPREVHPGLSTEVEPLLTRLLNKDPNMRPQSAAELLEAIERLSNYAQRETRLTQISSGIDKQSFAGGDLGDAVSSEVSGQLAVDVLSEMSKGTPGAWADSVKSPTLMRRPVVLVGIGSFVLIMAVGTVLLLGFRDDSSAISEKPVAIPVSSPDSADSNALASETKEESVVIAVAGIPDDAKIYYDDSLVPENPFRVEKGVTLVRLRVTAPGFKDFKYSVKPSEDRTVEVKLEALAEEPAPPAKKSSRGRGFRSRSRKKKEPDQMAPAAEKPKPEPKPEERPDKTKPKEGERGSLFFENFE